MHYPNKDEFTRLAKRGNLIPVYKEILADFETPLSAFTKIDGGSYSFLLESVEGGERIARYSFLGSSPSLIFSSKRNRISLTEGRILKNYTTNRDPIEELKDILKKYKFVKVKGLPRFSGGLVGFLGYDMVRYIERIPDKNPDDLKLPDSIFMLTDTLLIFDHVDHAIKVVSNAHVKGDPSKSYDEAVRKIDGIIENFKIGGPKDTIPHLVMRRASPLRLRSNYTKTEYENAVRVAKEYVKKGDVIQVVLSQRLQAPISSHPFQIYRALRSINPSPYMYYLKLGDFSLVCSSPEIMVRCEEGRVELRPIAGTRPRGGSEAEDAKLIKDLLSDPKERAEHIMLVDLGRNDIGRVCEYKTVKVSELMTIEKYSHVMHIVSDVSGILKKGKDIFDVVRASFPAGTVTGAPKVRAMEIIDELENVRRGPYAGSVGYFSFSGNLDSCITIRTILVKGKTAYIQAGAGIVADSKPDREYQETMNKAKALVRAIETAERGLE
ncbi:MAG: anthranilate synthase component I [Candidatus Omnitrophica bacterium]|nr:anthranilate synthase component I [Candidatus Omnitrophota bacterium]